MQLQTGDFIFSEPNLDLDIARDAQVSIVHRVEAQGAYNAQIRLEAGASLRFTIVCMEQDQVSYSLTSQLLGEGAKSDIDAVASVKDSMMSSLRIENVFDAPHCSGEIRMRGVAQNRAHLKLDGLIHIKHGAKETDAYLTQESLMLDAQAKVDCIPGLEIKNDNVKASHSATVTRLKPEDLFYFSSRGIPKDEAREMYIEGFLAALLPQE